MEDFSHEHLDTFVPENEEHISIEGGEFISLNTEGHLRMIIHHLNFNRREYLETKEKKYWWQMIQLLPSSYNQTRNVMLNYEVLANIYKSRKNHKLDEWREFCKWIEVLPYSELITELVSTVSKQSIIDILKFSHTDEEIVDKLCELTGFNYSTPEEHKED